MAPSTTRTFTPVRLTAIEIFMNPVMKTVTRKPGDERAVRHLHTKTVPVQLPLCDAWNFLGSKLGIIEDHSIGRAPPAP